MQVFHLPLSSLHWNVDEASLDLNLNVALFFGVFFFGPLVILVLGGLLAGGGG